MVSSILTVGITYEESNHLDNEDKGHISPLYGIECFNNKNHLYGIVIGKLRSNYADTHSIVYYPIYMVNEKNKIKSKIGVFEIETSEIASTIDKNGEIDINRLGEPLLFSFVDVDYLDKHAKKIEIDENEEEDEEERITDKEIKEPEDDPHEEEDDLFQINTRDKNDKALEALEDITNVTEKDEITLENLFTKDVPLPEVETWDTETEESAKKLVEEYRMSSKQKVNWINSFMRNNNYGVEEIAGDGNCFFTCIQYAYDSIGYRTSVDKIRKFLAENMTETQYELYKEIYDDLSRNKQNTSIEIDKLKRANDSLKKQSEKSKNLKSQKEIMSEAIQVKQDYIVMTSQNEMANDLLKDFGFMEYIKNIEDLKSFIRTPDFWADSWTITKLELILNMKFIIMEKTEDRDAVIRCIENPNEKILSFVPKYYIMVLFSGNNHYSLITYKEKKIFSFKEIPYDIKTLITKKCMEKRDTANMFNIIPEFKELRNTVGVETDEKTIKNSPLFDSDMILRFHETSDKSKKPGDIDIDMIPPRRLTEFAMLHKHHLWRRKLHDSWNEAQFTTEDGKRWSSVSHYLLALRFRDGYSDVYDELSLNSQSEISKSMKNAKAAVEKRGGKYYDFYKKTKPLDDDSYSTYRKNALKLKFSNKEYAILLKSTLFAKLELFRRGKQPIPDMLLMEVRSELD